MLNTQVYDTAIIGGGLAGLALSILLAKKNYSVILFEKENYPFHKVCGEYISSESIPFLKSLGIDIDHLNLPIISLMRLTSYAGNSIERRLDIGGTGISRYMLDELLYRKAIEAGVSIHTNTKVKKVIYSNDQFELRCHDSIYYSKTAIGAYGKHSTIDVQLGRSYRIENEKNLFVAVKHHIRYDFDKRYVEMHNFNGGYCGMSAIEDNKVNLSYICKASQLKKHGSITSLEQEVLSSNPYLKNYFSNAEFLFEKPLTISHLYFGIKENVSNHILMLGDAAGNIAPLSGNGMSMALRSALIASNLLPRYFESKLSRSELELNYHHQYHNVFHSRVMVAKLIHSSFGQKHLTNMSISLMKHFPFLIDFASKRIHGEEF